jgi:cell filamentation protein
MLFSSLYEWAGEIRRVGIWKGATKFCAPERIEKEAVKLFDALNQDFSEKGRFWNLNKAADRLAYHYGELNILHPFREGNGRTQRVLFEFIAQDIGYSIRWLDDSDQWIGANISAYTTDHTALREIFLDILEPA